MRKMVLLNLQGVVSGADEGTGDELHGIGTAARTSIDDISLLYRNQQNSIRSGVRYVTQQRRTDGRKRSCNRPSQKVRAMDLLIIAGNDYFGGRFAQSSDVY